MSSHAKIIASIPLVRALSPPLAKAVIQILDSVSQEFMVAKGETLFREGETGDNTGLILVSGSLEISHGSGKPKIVKVPEIFGEMHHLNDTGQRVATITASEPSTILKFSWHNFIGVLQKVGSISLEDRKELQRNLNQYGTVRVQELFKMKG